MMRLIRHSIFILIALFALSFAPLRAQEAQQKPEAAAQQPSGQPQAEQKPEEKHVTNPNAAASRELVEASKRAEGEEPEGKDQTEEMKHGLEHSTMVQKMARLFGISVQSAYWIAMAINFAIVFLAIGWVMKSKLPAMFRMRNEAIQRGIAEARAASEDAQRRLKDIEVRLSKLGEEVNAIKASAEKESAAEEARIRTQAENDVKRVLESAEKEIDAAGKQARRDLKSLAAGLAVDLATRKLQIDQQTDEGLVRNFVAQLGKDGQ